MQGYIEPQLTGKIHQKLTHPPGVIILGPRQCGKLTLAKVIISGVENALYLDLERLSDLSR